MFKWIRHWHNRVTETDYLRSELEDELEFIWGIKSYVDLSDMSANIQTMNDIELDYHKKLGEYSLSLETMIFFEDEDGDKRYVTELLEQFTKWMLEQGRSIETSENRFLYGVFTDGYNINTKFETIEEVYCNFKMLVEGYTKI